MVVGIECLDGLSLFSMRRVVYDLITRVLDVCLLTKSRQEMHDRSELSLRVNTCKVALIQGPSTG
jgi:hypothetical protein